VPESEVFHFDRFDSMRHTFGWSPAELSSETSYLASRVRSVPSAASSSLFDMHLQLATVFAILGDRPFMRYNRTHGASLALANALDEKFRGMAEA
jgi:hypothetical protein